MKRSIAMLGTAALAALVAVTGASAGDDHDHAAETKKAADAEMKSADKAEMSSPAIGQRAPSFTATDQTGNEVSLDDYAGKIVVLEWTSPACPVVQRHYADGTMTMTKLAEKYGDDVVWLAIDSSSFAKAETLQEWAKSKSIDYPILVDAEGAIGRAYGAKTTPHMFVIDADGNLAYEGAIDNDPRGNTAEPINYVEAAVDAVLAGKDVATTNTKSYGCSVKYSKGV